MCFARKRWVHRKRLQYMLLCSTSVQQYCDLYTPSGLDLVAVRLPKSTQRLQQDVYRSHSYRKQSRSGKLQKLPNGSKLQRLPTCFGQPLSGPFHHVLDGIRFYDIAMKRGPMLHNKMERRTVTGAGEAATHGPDDPTRAERHRICPDATGRCAGATLGTTAGCG